MGGEIGEVKRETRMFGTVLIALNLKIGIYSAIIDKKKKVLLLFGNP